jgi:glutamyl-tRNA synthetase
MARQAGAKIYMRMEDIDAVRAKPESVAQAYEDLWWLGMDWDQWPAASGQRSERGAVVQSERMRLYEEAVERLWQKGGAYPCVCTRAEIAASVAAGGSAPHEGEGHPRYPATCRGKFRGKTLQKALAAAFEASGREACLRAVVHKGLVCFPDAIAGHQQWDVAADAGDFPVTRFAERLPDGTRVLPPAYQLACIVDDNDMGIDMVVRGDDLLPSTPRQILLYMALQTDVPRFAHVPLVVGADGKRLAKRHGESRIAQFREAGVSAERVVGWVAWRSGQAEKPMEMAASELMQRFDLTKLPAGRVVLGKEDLEFLDRR